MGFVKAADVADVVPGSGFVVEVGGREYALFNVDGEFFCIDNECPHAGGPLGEGAVDKGTVMCPWHCWCFDIRTGDGLYGLGIGVGTYACSVDDGAVLIEV
jgi:nitrite reductase (NADH) small subunit/3-phenylpropionate/trans-cinnamate dioxygenase ferredoxin subunit